VLTEDAFGCVEDLPPIRDPLGGPPASPRVGLLFGDAGSGDY
jgi:hypothetical protein